MAAIVFWELAKLSQLGRIDIDLADPQVEIALASLHVWPLDLEIARASIELDFRGDPADELIAATSVVHAVPLVTRDRQMLSSTRVRWPASKRWRRIRSLGASANVAERHA